MALPNPKRNEIIIKFDDLCQVLKGITNQDGSSLSDDQPLSIIVQHKNTTLDISDNVALQDINGFDCELNPPPPPPGKCNDSNAINFGEDGDCVYDKTIPLRFTVSYPQQITFDDNSDIKVTLLPKTKTNGSRYSIKKSEIGFSTTEDNIETLTGADFTITETDGNIEYTFSKPKFVDEFKQGTVSLRFRDNIATENNTTSVTITFLPNEEPKVEICNDPQANNYGEEGECTYDKKPKFCLDCLRSGIQNSLREGIDDIDVTTSREETVPIVESERFLKYAIIDNLGNYNTILNWVRGGNLQQIESEIDVLDSIVLKLESPLPQNVTRLDLTDLYKTEFLPLSIDIDLSEQVVEDRLTYLRPNFSADIDTKTNQFSDYQNYNTITLDQNTTVQEQVVDYYLQRDKNKISLNTDFTDFTNFVKFSSAEERLNNFFYKTQLIETYTSQSASVALTGTSIYKTKQLEKISDGIRTTKNSFDDYEYFLYNDSGSFYSSSFVSSSDGIYASYPKKSDNTLYHTTSSIVTSWFDSITNVAKDFDNLNRDSFRNNTPEFIREDQDSEEYVLFVDMVGHLMDELYIYSKELSNLYDWNLDKTKGLSEDLSIVLLNMFADNLDTSFAEKSVWEYILGLSSDGSDVSTSNSDYTFKSQQKETLRRLLTNLPHLLKHKGTRRSIRGLINSYGIPESTLKVQEYGTFQTPNGTEVEEFTQETDYKLLINSSTDSRIELTDSSLDGIKAVEFNVQWSGTRTSSAIFRGIDSDTGGDFNIILEPTQSGNFGMVVLQIDDTSNVFEVSSSVVPIYNGLFTNILVQQIQSGSYELYVNQYDVIDNEFDYQTFDTGSASTAISSSIDNVFNDVDKFVFGYSSSDNLNFSGYLDELRIWKSTLTQDNFNTHTKYPKSITLNNALDIPTSLVVRADLESQFKSDIIGTPGSLPNLVFDPTFATTLDVYGVASDDYKTFTRDVRVVSPNIGNDKLGNNKVRFGLNQSLQGNVLTPSNLSNDYKSNEIITDEILDSNELVVGFSPTDILNQIIIQHFGSTDLVDEYGDATEQYNDTYNSLSTLVENFFANISENYKTKFFIDYIRNFDKTLFNNIKKFVPEKAALTTGIFIEPHLLNRSKAPRLAKSTSEDQTKTGGNIISPTTPLSEYLTKVGEPISVYDSTERLIGNSFGISVGINGEANVIISQDEIGEYLSQNTSIIVLKDGFEQDILNYIKPEEDMIVRVRNNYGEVFLFEFRKYGGNEFLSQLTSYENQITSIPLEDRNNSNQTYVDIVRNYDELYSLYNKLFLIKYPYSGTKPGIAATLEDIPSLLRDLNLVGDGTNVTTTSNKGGISSSNDSLGTGDSAVVTTTLTSTTTRVTDPDGDIKLTVE